MTAAVAAASGWTKSFFTASVWTRTSALARKSQDPDWWVGTKRLLVVRALRKVESLREVTRGFVCVREERCLCSVNTGEWFVVANVSSYRKVMLTRLRYGVHDEVCRREYL